MLELLFLEHEYKTEKTVAERESKNSSPHEDHQVLEQQAEQAQTKPGNEQKEAEDDGAPKRERIDVPHNGEVKGAQKDSKRKERTFGLHTIDEMKQYSPTASSDQPPLIKSKYHIIPSSLFCYHYLIALRE
jgi:hypothetical protein